MNNTEQCTDNNETFRKKSPHLKILVMTVLSALLSIISAITVFVNSTINTEYSDINIHVSANQYCHFCTVTGKISTGIISVYSIMSIAQYILFANTYINNGLFEKYLLVFIIDLSYYTMLIVLNIIIERFCTSYCIKAKRFYCF